MKLRFELEFVQIGDEWSCVPLDNDNGESFHGVLNINESAKEMLEAIQSSTTPEEAFAKILKNHPEETPDKLGPEFADFLNQLVREGLLIP